MHQPLEIFVWMSIDYNVINILKFDNSSIIKIFFSPNMHAYAFHPKFPLLSSLTFGARFMNLNILHFMHKSDFCNLNTSYIYLLSSSTV